MKTHIEFFFDAFPPYDGQEDEINPGRYVKRLAEFLVTGLKQKGFGYTVVLIFIRIESADESSRRVAMRVCQSGHDVPDDKLRARFERTLANLQRAVERLPHVIVFSNKDLSNPFQLIAAYENGQTMEQKTDE